MRLKIIALQAYFLIGLSVISAQAQIKDSILFLGDTLSLTPAQVKEWASMGQPFLEPLSSSDSRVLASKIGKVTFKDQQFIIADPLDDGVTKILVIGNSFSDDAVEYYLHDLAKQTGRPLVIGNLFRGGAPLDFHLKNALEDNAIYDYRKTSIDGAKSNRRYTSILMALKDENWDIICFQQASLLSGDLASVQKDLPALFTYVKENYPVSTVKYAFHQTWAYAENAKTKNFEKYNNNQQLMYDSIVNVSKEIKNIIPLDFLIPSGTAIQNGRSSYIGDNFNREGYHLDLRIGRFTAACAWYESIFGDLEINPFKPFNLSLEQANIAKEAATLAVKSPFKHSYLSSRNSILKPINFSSIQVNFGADLVMPGWNSFLFERENTMLSGLVDESNNSTQVYVRLLRNFDARSANGPKRTSSPFKMPAEVSSSYFEATLNKENETEAFLEIGNLNVNKTYNLSIFSGVESNQSPIGLSVSNANKAVVDWIDPSYNKIKSSNFLKLKPDAEGKLRVEFSIPNGLQNSVAIINALCITEN